MRDEVLIGLVVIMLVISIVTLWYATETAALLYGLFGR